MDNKEKNSKKNTHEFLELVPNLEAVEFLGLCATLKVPLFEDSEQKKARDFLDLLPDLCEAFSNSSRSCRRDILVLLRRAKKEKSKMARKNKEGET